MDTIALLKEFVKKHVDNPPEQIHVDSKLAEIGIDSLSLLELLFEVEEKFGVRFSNDMPRPETVGELVDTFEKAISKKSK